MSETIAVIITLVVTIIIQMLKPEWFIGWLIAFLNKKLPGKSNKIENSLGQKLIEMGVYVISYNQDDEKIKEIIKTVEEASIKLKDELKNL